LPGGGCGGPVVARGSQRPPGMARACQEELGGGGNQIGAGAASIWR